MKTGKKVLFLFLGLVLPLMIFVFLKMFGKNEFEVPLLYERGVEKKPMGCDISYNAPYRVPDSVAIRLFTEQRPALLLINFGEPTVRLRAIARSLGNEVKLVNESEMSMPAEKLSFIKSCVLLIEKPNTLVMLDDQNRIRGYYDGTDRDDLDRLEAEVNIILKKY
jgi:hypothetical protein